MRIIPHRASIKLTSHLSRYRKRHVHYWNVGCHMRAPWPRTKTLVTWSVSAAVAGVVVVIAGITRDERLLLEASSGFLSVVIGECIHEVFGTHIHRIVHNLLYLPGANKAAAHNNCGNSHDQRGDLESAIADYTEALRFNPKYIEALINRGRCFSKKGDCEKAIADFGEAIRLDPKNPIVYFYGSSRFLVEAEGK